MSQFTSYKPACRVLVRELGTMAEKHNITNDIVSLATNRAYGRSAGTWQIMLTFKRDDTGKTYNELIGPNMVVTIELDAGDGSGMWPVMLGLVDRVAVVRQGGDIPVRQVKLSGQDYGKLLAVHNIGWDITTKPASYYKQSGTFIDFTSYARRQLLQVGTAQQLTEQIFGIFKNDLAATSKQISLNVTTPDEWKLNKPQLVQIARTPTWNVMKTVAHEPYNMLHCDTDTVSPTQFQITLERNPITKEGKLDLTDINRLHKLTDAEIIADDLGTSDIERVNMLCYWPSMYKAMAEFAGVEVAMAHPDLTKVADNSDPDNGVSYHGWVSHIVEDSFVPQEVEGPVQVYAKDWELDENRRLADTYWNWNKDNHKLESGTIQIHMRPDIRAGNCLLVQQPYSTTYKEYLIEQVSHQCSWHPTPQFVTTLHVTRGQKATLNKVQTAQEPAQIKGGSTA